MVLLPAGQPLLQVSLGQMQAMRPETVLVAEETTVERTAVTRPNPPELWHMQRLGVD